MALPKTINEPYEHDPLVLLPLADPLPASPAAQVPALTAALEAHLASAEGAFPLPAITGTMRTAARNAQVTQNASRLSAAEARVELDKADVQLRTALYELARVREEMAVCRAYEPMYETMVLPTEEDFLASADPDVLASLPRDGSDERKYALLLARLEAELAHVITQEAQVAELTKERDALLRSRREVTKKFEAVDVYLGDFAKTSSAMASKIRDVGRAATADKEKEKDGDGKGREDKMEVGAKEADGKAEVKA